METIRQIIQNNHSNIVNNDNRYKSNNGINGNSGSYKSKYALDRTKFKPNTEEAILAEEIASKFNDLDNFACHYGIVKRLGCFKVRSVFSETIGEIEEKKNTKYPVRNPVRFYMWKVKRCR